MNKIAAKERRSSLAPVPVFEIIKGHGEASRQPSSWANVKWVQPRRSKQERGLRQLNAKLVKDAKEIAQFARTNTRRLTGMDEL